MLEKDLRLECYTDTWFTYALVAVAGVMLYPIGILVLFAALLYVHRNFLHLDISSAEHAVQQAADHWQSIKDIVDSGPASTQLLDKMSNELLKAKQKLQKAEGNYELLQSRMPRHLDVRYRYGFIFDQYCPHAFYWEICELLRKLFLASLLTFVDPGTTAQLIWALMICLFFLILQVLILPHKSVKDHHYSFGSMVALILCCVSGLALRAQKANKEESTPYTTFLINAMLIGCNVGMLLCFVFFGITTVRLAGGMTGVRLARGRSQEAGTYELLNRAVNSTMHNTMRRANALVNEINDKLERKVPQLCPELTMIMKEIASVLCIESAACTEVKKEASEIKALQYEIASNPMQEPTSDVNNVKNGSSSQALDEITQRSAKLLSLVKDLKRFDEMCGSYSGSEGKRCLVGNLQALLSPRVNIPMGVFQIAKEFAHPK